MKKIAFILAAVLNITINNTIAQDQFHTTVSGSYDGAMRDLLAQARPDRGAPLTYERRGNQVNFYEYYVSGEDNGATYYREALAIAHTLADRALVQKAEKGINNCTRAQQRRDSQNQNRPQGYRPAVTSTSSQRITGNKRPYDQEYPRGGYRDDDHDKRRRRM